jgi:hypothetical protein
MKYHNKIAKNIVVTAIAAVSLFGSSLSAQFAGSVMPTVIVPGGASQVKPPILLPNPNDRVIININHQRQESMLCLPTCASMMLNKFGWNYPPRQIKLATMKLPYYGPNTPFKYWTSTSSQDIMSALNYLGIKSWRSSHYLNNDSDFNRGFDHIKASLKMGYPVMVIIRPSGGYLHAVVVNGFDESKKIIHITDPGTTFNKGAATYSYSLFKAIWRNTSNNRTAIFMY